MTDLQISRLPNLRSLQQLQMAADLVHDSTEKEKITRHGLSQIALDNVMGVFFAVEASVAIAASLDVPTNKRKVYDKGLKFSGFAVNADFERNYDVPCESTVIDFCLPRILAEEDQFTPEVATDLVENYHHGVDQIRVPILAIKVCAVQSDRLAA